MTLNFCPDRCKVYYAFSVNHNLPFVYYGVFFPSFHYVVIVYNKHSHIGCYLLDFQFSYGIINLTYIVWSSKGGCHAKRKSGKDGGVAGQWHVQRAERANHGCFVCARDVFRSAGPTTGEVRDVASGARGWFECGAGIGGFWFFADGVLRDFSCVGIRGGKWFVAQTAWSATCAQTYRGSDGFRTWSSTRRCDATCARSGRTSRKAFQPQDTSTQHRTRLSSGTKKRALVVNESPADCCGAYEQLRMLSLHHPTHEQGRWGMALFLGRGFVAWMRAWSQATPKRECPVRKTTELISLPNHIQTQMVSTLAGMVLDTLCQEVA